MYETGTILRLREPRKVKNKQGDEVEFPYNRVEVLGPSPINHGLGNAEWTGAAGQGVLIRPLTEFGGNLDEPIGRLQSLYEVESIPEKVAPAPPQIRVVDSSTSSAGQTPEEVFAEEARKNPPGPSPRRQRRAKASPLAAKADESG